MRRLSLRRAPRGAYTGRLTFDPDTGFHTDPDGHNVVTDDAGRTWRYATKTDTSHNARYSQRVVGVDTTPNLWTQIAVEHGSGIANTRVQMEQPHHFAVQPIDDHYDSAAPSLTRLKFDPDEVAATLMSHTEAYA